MKFRGGLTMLREALGQLSPAEETAARYILEHPQQVATLTISELARRAETSSAAIVRLARKLNMDGFRELKLRVTMDVTHSDETNEQVQIERDAAPADIVRSVLRNNRAALESLELLLDINGVEQAAELIVTARSVAILGIGASGVAAMDLLQKLKRVGLPGLYSSDPHLQIISACSLGTEDVVVAISYSGETPEVLRAVREARERRAKVVSITRFGTTPVSELAHVALFVPSIEPLIREGAMASRIAQLALVDALFSVLLSKAPDRFIEMIDQTRLALEGRLSATRSREESRKGDQNRPTIPPAAPGNDE